MGQQLDDFCLAAQRDQLNYRSIFLEPDWLHVRHLGWADAWPDPDLRVMTRRDGPVQRHLLVSARGLGADQLLDDQISRLSLPSSEITIHDLIGDPLMADLLAKRGFRELAGERMLNIYTMVFDLTKSEEELLAAMNTDTRRKLRQAEAAGVCFVDNCHSDPKMVDRFLESYNTMACERALSGMDKREFEAMIADGSAHLVGAFNTDQSAATFVLTYLAGGSALFHHGASDGPSDPLLGRAVHWGLIRKLKAEGFAWYDMGGLPTLDPANGITRFKLGFGGAVVELGREYRWSGALVRLLRYAKRLLRR